MRHERFSSLRVKSTHNVIPLLPNGGKNSGKDFVAFVVFNDISRFWPEKFGVHTIVDGYGGFLRRMGSRLGKRNNRW